MAKTGKSVKQLIGEVYEVVGAFNCDRDDLHIEEEQKQAVIKRSKENPYTAFGPYKVESLETLDGFKYNLGDDRWVMLRASGTEPVLRVYAQAADAQEVRKILDAAKATIFGE